MNHRKFYIELGKLFYAIANADGKVQSREVAALREAMQREFIPIEAGSDEYGVNDAYYAEYEFEALNEKSADVETAFTSFIDFARKNRRDLDVGLKRSCICAAEDIAGSFHKKNIYETRYIDRLKRELGKI